MCVCRYIIYFYDYYHYFRVKSLISYHTMNEIVGIILLLNIIKVTFQNVIASYYSKTRLIVITSYLQNMFNKYSLSYQYPLSYNIQFFYGKKCFNFKKSILWICNISNIMVTWQSLITHKSEVLIYLRAPYGRGPSYNRWPRV